MRQTDTSANRLAAVRGEIEKACREAGRAPNSVTLVAISKTFGAARTFSPLPCRLASVVGSDPEPFQTLVLLTSVAPPAR